MSFMPDAKQPLFNCLCQKKRGKKNLQKENSKSRAAALGEGEKKRRKKEGASIFRLTACIGKWTALM